MSKTAFRDRKDRAESKGKAQGIAILALIVSTLSFVVNFYWHELAPFEPIVTAGGPMFQFDIAAPENLAAHQAVGPDFDPAQGRVLAAVFVPVTVTHKGGRPGVVVDFMLRLSRKNYNDRWLFEPRMFIDEKALLTAFEPRGHLKWIEGIFAPIPLAKGTQAHKLIMFQGQENTLFPGYRVRPGAYTLHVLSRLAGNDGFEQIENFEVDFNTSVLNSLERQHRYVPTPASLLPAREQLKR